MYIVYITYIVYTVYMYPTLDDLRKIHEFEGTPEEMVELLRSIWEYAEWGFRVRNGRDSLNRACIKVEISTAGWSGNEDLISELEGTFFWFLYWWSSRRGGHYEFRISKNMYKQMFDLGKVGRK